MGSCSTHAQHDRLKLPAELNNYFNKETIRDELDSFLYGIFLINTWLAGEKEDMTMNFTSQCFQLSEVLHALLLVSPDAGLRMSYSNK